MNRRRRGRHGPPITLFSFQDIIASVTGVVIFITFMLMLELVMRPATAATSPQTEAMPSSIDDAERRLAELRQRQPVAPVSEVELAAAREATAALADLARVLEERGTRLAPRVEEVEKGLNDRRIELQAVERRLEEARRELERERTRTRVTLLEGPRDGKETWFIECDATEVRVGQVEAGTSVARLERRFASADEVLQWSLARPADRHRFVLVARPEGIESFSRLQQAFRGQGRDLGWDLWPLKTPLFSEEVVIDGSTK